MPEDPRSTIPQKPLNSSEEKEYEYEEEILEEKSLEEKVLSVDTKTAVKKDDLIGKIIANKFQVIAKIGAGGMGAVYKARQLGLDRDVAIKVMLKEYTKDERIIKRFQIEALAVAKLKHPNIVEIYDFGQMKNGDLYIAMEFLEGRPLDNLLKQVGILPVGTALHIIEQVASSLAQAHAKGIVHRDLKPENIFLVTVGSDPHFVKLLDFGVAKLKEGDKRLGTVTQTGAIFGTPKYMAPEQCRGKEVDGRTDIYAMGVILYEMLTGHTPFSGDSPIEIMLKHVQEKPKPPTVVKPELDIPKEVEELVMKCLEKEKENRFQSAGEFLATLAAVEAGLGNKYSHVVYVSPSIRDARRKSVDSEAPTVYDTGHMEDLKEGRSKLPWVIVGLLLLIIGGFGAWFGMQQGQKSDTSATSASVSTHKNVKAIQKNKPKVEQKPKTIIKTVAVPVEKAPPQVTFTVTSEPSKAKVFIDGQEVGTTPYIGKLPKEDKKVKIKIVRPGYISAVREIDLSKDQALFLKLKKRRVARKKPKTGPPAVNNVVKKKKKSSGPAKVKDLKSIF